MTYPHLPSQHRRLHFSRSRTLRDVETLLLHLASLIAARGIWEKESGAGSFLEQMRRIPALATQKKKSIDNTYTETTRLYALLYEVDGVVAAAPNAILLAQEQDLPTFFVRFLRRFQFPGGFLKPQDVLQDIKDGIRLKPGHYIVNVLLEGNRLLDDGESFGITRSEVTWYVLNDLQVTRDARPPADTAELILAGRKSGVVTAVPNPPERYGLPSSLRKTPTDFDRYGRDCLTFLELAGVVRKGIHGRYYLRPDAVNVILALAEDDSWFEGFDALRSDPTAAPRDVKALQHEWELYANELADAQLRGGSMLAPPMLPTMDAAAPGVVIPSPEGALQSSLDSMLAEIALEPDVNTREIGELGEALVVRHEANMLRACGRHDLAKQVQKIPDKFGVGYDVKSFHDNGTPKMIEVKTTRSHAGVHVNRFHMTPNEWVVAESVRDSYYVYRLQLSDEAGAKLVTIRDPVGLYKRDRITMEPRNGALVSYPDDYAEIVELVVGEE